MIKKIFIIGLMLCMVDNSKASERSTQLSAPLIVRRSTMTNRLATLSTPDQPTLIAAWPQQNYVNRPLNDALLQQSDFYTTKLRHEDKDSDIAGDDDSDDECSIAYHEEEDDDDPCSCITSECCVRTCGAIIAGVMLNMLARLKYN